MPAINVVNDVRKDAIVGQQRVLSASLGESESDPRFTSLLCNYTEEHTDLWRVSAPVWKPDVVLYRD